MTKYIAKVLSLTLALAAASNISAADYADFDSPGAWKVSNPSSQQSIEWITDYSPRLKVVKVTMLPIKQWYAEISPKNLPQIAKSPEDLNLKVSWEFLCDTPEIMTQIAVRIVDSQEKYFNSRKSLPAQWSIKKRSYCYRIPCAILGAETTIKSWTTH
ncbi:MAG: hypothetical protein ACLUKN_05605 [Bacilli bacterium]